MRNRPPTHPFCLLIRHIRHYIRHIHTAGLGGVPNGAGRCAGPEYYPFQPHLCTADAPLSPSVRDVLSGLSVRPFEACDYVAEPLLFKLVKRYRSHGIVRM